MQKISELKPGAQIEIKVEIKSIQPIRKIWKCFECDAKGLWKKEEEVRDDCPQCQAKVSNAGGKGVWIQEVTSAWIKDDSGYAYLDLWKDDIGQYNIGDKIHLINGYAYLNKKTGQINVAKGNKGVIRKLED